MGKIQPGKPVSGTQYGTTLTNSDTHAPTLKGSSTSPKSKIKPNGITANSPQGTTFVGNKSIMGATKPSTSPNTSKVQKSGSNASYVPKGHGSLGGGNVQMKSPPVKKR